MAEKKKKTVPASAAKAAKPEKAARPAKAPSKKVAPKKQKKQTRQEPEMTWQPKQQQPSWFRRNFITIVLFLALFAGGGLMAYPTVADYWNSIHGTRAISSYMENVAKLSGREYRELLDNALAYNARVAQVGFSAPSTEERRNEYNSLLSFTLDGLMGSIEISKINVTLPIYHGTTDEVLQLGVGHLDWSSLPVGAASFDYNTLSVSDPDDGAHSVLSGHRGLPTARLFTDLDQLVVGDSFVLTVLGDLYTYTVDQIRIVEPTDVSELHIEPGKDYCTLVTCTPYGINSHRMLVRGVRTENVRHFDVRIVAEALLIDPVQVAPVIAVPILFLLLIWMLIVTGGKRRTPSMDELFGEDEGYADAHRSAGVMLTEDEDIAPPLGAAAAKKKAEADAARAAKRAARHPQEDSEPLEDDEE